MCEYCKNVKTGDDYKAIVGSEIQLGMFGLIDCEVSLGGARDQNPSMVLSYIYENSEGHGCEDHEERVPINFCPMCGAKLREV